MKLTTRQKFVVYQLIALGTKSCEIVRKFNEQFPARNEQKPLVDEQVADYRRRFKDLIMEEQISFLPHSMESSFSLQEVRINDDIKDLEKLNEALEDKNCNKIEIIRAKISIKNRIGQELGQLQAFAKGGVGNVNILQLQINKFRTNLSNIVNLTPEDRLELLKRANMAEANVKSIKQ